MQQGHFAILEKSLLFTINLHLCIHVSLDMAKMFFGGQQLVL